MTEFERLRWRHYVPLTLAAVILRILWKVLESNDDVSLLTMVLLGAPAIVLVVLGLLARPAYVRAKRQRDAEAEPRDNGQEPP